MTGIVASVGTDHHPFDRLVTWLDVFATAHPEVEVFVQHGSSGSPNVADGRPLLPLEDLRARFADAIAIVTHGGPATIMDAIDAGRTPIVVPRRPDLGEHVDDHQLLFARRLATAGRILLVDSREDLDHHLRRALEDPSVVRTTDRGSDLAVSVDRFARLVGTLRP